MKRINDILSDFGSVTIDVYSQYEPDRLLESVTTSDRNHAENIVLMYSNDYVYIHS